MNATCGSLTTCVKSATGATFASVEYGAPVSSPSNASAVRVPSP